MTREELIKHLEHLAEYVKYSEDAPALREAIKMLTETHGNARRTHACDCIYRQDAIDAFDGVKVDDEDCTEYEIGYNDGIDFAVSRLSMLPSAQSEQTDCEYCHEDSDGFVIPVEKNGHVYIHFGMNGWCLELRANRWHGEAKINYCPMCGRRLER